RPTRVLHSFPTRRSSDLAPYDIHTSYFRLDSQYGYGYTKMVCPVGGPQVLSSVIAQTFLAQGGKILLETRYQKNQKTDNGYHVEDRKSTRLKLQSRENLV